MAMGDVAQCLNDIASDKVQAVDISCKGDLQFLGKVKFTKLEIPKSHRIFCLVDPTQISIHMGIPPLVMKHDNFNFQWMRHCNEGKLRQYPFSNPNALFLNLRCDPTASSWGFADMMKWDLDIGTVLATRQDKKPITPHHVEALARFCRYKLCPAMGYHSESFWEETDNGFTEGEEDEEKETNKRLIASREEFNKNWLCRTKFDDFFYQLKAERLAAGDSSWQHEITPYAV
ncbi:hypothetical protein B0J14DRAFT_669253 [Halenospora varia]|nr:hypothetical protein B0J14DRAFT_669253 [Halenospora varia]